MEVDPYEEIVGDLDYSTPITSRSASPNRYEEDQKTVATFQGPITHSSESTVTSASAGLVASVPWPALRSPCSIAGKYQEPRSHTRSDGSSATHPAGGVAHDFAVQMSLHFSAAGLCNILI